MIFKNKMEININLENENLKEVFEEIGNFEKKFAFYSSEELFSLGRQSAKEGNYLQAKFIFRELLRRDGSKDCFQLYNSLITFSAMYRNVIERGGRFAPEEFNETLKRKSIDTVVEGMINAVSLYQERKISREDLLIMEKMVDLFPFNQTVITGRAEFEKIYSKFKEYLVKIYLEEQKNGSIIRI
jgi:tetratricopeptide (TPR) repeat protein